MQTLSKDQIVAAMDIATEVVPVPEWGGAVAVRALNGLERDAFEQTMVRVDADGKRQANLSNMRAKLCAACIVDGVTGDRLFTDATLGELANKSAVALDRVFRVAQRINGMGDGADVEKNSAPGPSGSSTSA
jgi:hypothetical protein